MKIKAPERALWILERLSAAGHAAYLVGGGLRDSLLSRPPGDWDIATAARPEQVSACFAEEPGCTVLPTGLRHGTVTLLVERRPFEVTTFRVDGAYSDHRRPDSVRFVEDLRADLARRDFAMNALAYRPEEGLVDYFGGRRDIEAGRIACVGDPATRFGEDALRILRAVRFAAQLGFSIAEETGAALTALAPTLAAVAPERLSAELGKALLGEKPDALAEYPAVLFALFPELEEAGIDAPAQALRAARTAPADLALRLALLLHPLPADKQAAAVLRLRFAGEICRRVERLANFGEAEILPTESALLHLLHRLGEADLRRQLSLRRALGEDTGPAEAALDELLRAGRCYRLRDLAVGGEDLLAAGIPPGRAVGEALDWLLAAVMDGALPNERAALLEEVHNRWTKGEEDDEDN